MVFTDDPSSLAEFYKKVFGSDPGWTDGGFSGFAAGSGYLMVGPHDKVHGKSSNPERVIFNFETTDVEGEYKRILGIGAESVAEPYHPGEDKDMTLATLAEPDGNYFQLASPMK